METEASGEVLTKNNDKLLSIAVTADAFFWIGVIFIPISCMAKTQQFKNQFELLNISQNINASFVSNMISNPTYGFQFLGELFHLIFIGFVIILILRGISLGLRMIIETDVNYRLMGEKK